MTTCLYLTADHVGALTGGGAVTRHESEALSALAPTVVLSRNLFPDLPHNPFEQDDVFCQTVAERSSPENYHGRLKLAHGYAGCLSDTVDLLHDLGVKTTYTAAAHSVEKSRKAHQDLGLAFDYPHLNDPGLWQKYLHGYLTADVLVVPSTLSADVMREYGYRGKIYIIPHGCVLPEKTFPPPTRFTVGYLGSFGADKGLKYLLQAWKKLNYVDAVLLLGGRDSLTPWASQLIATFGGGNVRCTGWLPDVSSFYNGISLYVQPSVTEGFGIEVLEAMAHGRPVVCSQGAGAGDFLSHAYRYPHDDVDRLCDLIEKFYRESREWRDAVGHDNRGLAAGHTWGEVGKKYTSLWEGML